LLSDRAGSSVHMICLVHIERSGGTTLHYLLRNNFLGFLTLTPWERATHEDNNVLQAREAALLCRLLPCVKGFGGHTTRSYLRYEEAIGRPVHYITFLRDPVERYISHFRYQRGKMGIPWTLDSFMASSQFDNFMTRRIAGSDDLDEAKRALREDFAFVGLTSRFDESLVLMKERLALPALDIRYEPRNASPVTRSPSGGVELERDALRQIEAHNELDAELYRYCAEEVFERYLLDYEGAIDDELFELQSQNDDFRFGRLRMMAWRAYRYLIYRRLEYLVHRWYHR
jgi:hypothetical protein